MRVKTLRTNELHQFGKNFSKKALKIHKCYVG